MPGFIVCRFNVPKAIRLANGFIVVVYVVGHGKTPIRMYTGLRLIERTADGDLVLCTDNIELFISLVRDFLLRDPTTIKSSKKLAEYMAIHAQTIRSVITGILKVDDVGHLLADKRQQKISIFKELFGLYSKIKAELRPMLDTGKFSDMYAQTIVYGLFIARYNDARPREFQPL